MVILHAVAEELGGSGLARDDRILHARLACGPALVIDHPPHPFADFFKLVGRNAPLLDEICGDLGSLLFDDGPVLGDDFFHKVGLIDNSPVGHGRRDDRHLEGGGQHESLTNGGVGRVTGTPALTRVVLCKPCGAGQNSGGDIIKREFTFLTEPHHAAHGVDLIDAGGISILEKVGVAGVLDGSAEILMAMRGLLRLGGEHPALHVLVAVLDAATAVEILVAHPGTNTSQRGAELEGGARGVGVDGAVHQRVGLILGEFFPISP